MKKLFILFFIFLCGCSSKTILNCGYVDNSSILGSKSVNDVIAFKNDKIISFQRIIDFNLNDGLDNDIGDIYKIMKFEGKALKKYIGGKYRIKKNIGVVNLMFFSKKINNLKYIGIVDDGYDSVLGVYSELGFSCN